MEKLGVPFDYQGNATAPFCKVSLKTFFFYINRIYRFLLEKCFIQTKLITLQNTMILSSRKIEKKIGRHVKMGIAMLNRMRNRSDDPCVVIEDIWKQKTKIDVYCPSEDQTNDSEAKCTYPKGLFC